MSDVTTYDLNNINGDIYMCDGPKLTNHKMESTKQTEQSKLLESLCMKLLIVRSLFPTPCHRLSNARVFESKSPVENQSLPGFSCWTLKLEMRPSRL